MNKNEYSQLQMLLAKLRFELALKRYETSNDELVKKFESQLEAINEVMNIFLIDVRKK